MKKFKGAVVLLGLFLIAFAPAQAVMLNYGDTIGGAGDALYAQYLLDSAGPIVKDTGVLKFTADTGVYSGTFRQVVYREVAVTALCPTGGCLDFYYQFSNNSGSVDSIGRMTTIAFSGFSLDVGTAAPAMLLPGLSSKPADALQRSAAPGSTVAFRYDTLVPEIGRAHV